jgi:hydroxymethylglutaryl-CoA synthase
MHISETLVGIDAMAAYIPPVELAIADLAIARNIEPEKLQKGLGLYSMALPDTNEDAASMGANAIVELMERHGLDPNKIGRIYVGTESGLDGAKPLATYLLDMVRAYYKPQFGGEVMRNCDVVDLTFACIGGVDALQNCLDWVAVDTQRQAIVVCTDYAKYDLKSTGEYTQGAGAVAMLVKQEPRLLAIGRHWGVATKSVHDFFKPRLEVDTKVLIEQVLQAAGLAQIDVPEVLAVLQRMDTCIDYNEPMLQVHKDTPVFEGQYSNQCYQDRIREAFAHFCAQNELEASAFLQRFARLIYHLPYAGHGRRISAELYQLALANMGEWEAFAEANGLSATLPTDAGQYAKLLNSITKTSQYGDFVAEKLDKAQAASSQIGNMYTSSIFMALMSTLESDLENPAALAGQKIGFFAYGSGSKAKVFEAQVQPNWEAVAQKFELKAQLNRRTKIDFETYTNLHRCLIKDSLAPQAAGFRLESIGQEAQKEGARYYKWHGAR